MTKRNRHPGILIRRRRRTVSGGGAAAGFAVLLVVAGPVAGAQPGPAGTPRGVIPNDVLLPGSALMRLGLDALERGVEPPYTTKPPDVTLTSGWTHFIQGFEGYGEATIAGTSVTKMWWDGNHQARVSGADVTIQQVPRNATSRELCGQLTGGAYTRTVTVSATTCYVKWSYKAGMGWTGGIDYVTTPRPGIRIVGAVHYFDFPQAQVPKALAAAKAIATA